MEPEVSPPGEQAIRHSFRTEKGRIEAPRWNANEIGKNFKSEGSTPSSAALDPHHAASLVAHRQNPFSANGWK
jgi:hypothetical protein